MTDIEKHVRRQAEAARSASAQMAMAETAAKNQSLEAIADHLIEHSAQLIEANQSDLASAEARGLDHAQLDRLRLDEKRIRAMADGVRDVAALPDPVGGISELAYRPSGIQVGRMRVPLGVIGIIYESRPNVTVDAAALCIKSGNACILRGGSESLHSNTAIMTSVMHGLESQGLPGNGAQFIGTTDRTAVGALLSMHGLVDVIIPRGGRSLIERVAAESTIPVIKHLDGICHVYVDGQADVGKAIRIADNAKTHRYGVCNAMETLLVAASVAASFLPQIAAIYREKGVEMRGCPKSCQYVPDMLAADETDWSTEYLAPIIAIRVVADMDEAIAHIRQYGSGHTDAIVTENITRARRFMREVDASSVMVNASTRFADGYEYGLGAEIGISTDKLHARGPVGLEGLTSQKFIVFGDGHIRQ